MRDTLLKFVTTFSPRTKQPDHKKKKKYYASGNYCRKSCDISLKLHLTVGFSYLETKIKNKCLRNLRYLMLKLSGVSCMNRYNAAINMQLSDDGAASLQLWPKRVR